MARKGVKAAPRSSLGSRFDGIMFVTSRRGFGRSLSRCNSLPEAPNIFDEPRDYNVVFIGERPPEVNVIHPWQLSESESEPLTPACRAEPSPSHALPILHRLAAHLHAGDHLALELHIAHRLTIRSAGRRGHHHRSHEYITQTVDSRDAEAHMAHGWSHRREPRRTFPCAALPLGSVAGPLARRTQSSRSSDQRKVGS
jgi:hypothetical protein